MGMIWELKNRAMKKSRNDRLEQFYSRFQVGIVLDVGVSGAVGRIGRCFGDFTMWIIREDLMAQREGLLAQGFWALAVYRFGHARYRFRAKLIRWPWALVHILLSKLIEMSCGISIGPMARIGRRVAIEHFGSIIIHGAAEIGDDVMIRQGVTIGNKNSDRPQEAPKIGDKVDIGAGAKVLGAITIGDGAVIGANAVVIRDVPPYSLAVGVPATIKASGTRIVSQSDSS